MCVCVYVPAYMYKCVCVCVCIYTHTHLFMYVCIESIYGREIHTHVLCLTIKHICYLCWSRFLFYTRHKLSASPAANMINNLKWEKFNSK